MKKCKCGSKNFEAVCSTRVELELKDGVLIAVNEEDLGDSGVYTCPNCETEYSRSDFKEIIYP